MTRIMLSWDGSFVTLMETSSDSLGVQWKGKQAEMGGGTAFQGKSEKVNFQKAVDLKNTGELWKERSVRNCESVRKDSAFDFLDKFANEKAQ